MTITQPGGRAAHHAHGRRANTAKLLATARAVPLFGPCTIAPSTTSVVDPPPSRFTASHTPKSRANTAATAPTVDRSTAAITTFRRSSVNPISVREVATSYHELPFPYLPSGVKTPSGCAASRYTGIVNFPAVTTWADPATTVHNRPAYPGPTNAASFVADTCTPGASATNAYACRGFSNSENRRPSAAAKPIKNASISADGNGSKKCAFTQTCAASSRQKSTVVRRTVSRPPPGCVS